MKIEKNTSFVSFVLFIAWFHRPFVRSAPFKIVWSFPPTIDGYLRLCPPPFFPRGKEDSKSEGKQFWLGKLYFYRWKTFLSFLLLRVLAVIVEGYWKMERAVLCCGDVFNVCGCVCTCKFFKEVWRSSFATRKWFPKGSCIIDHLMDCTGYF